ncbi:MAG: aminopeptidase P family protein [Candidatus Nanopelagicales bacterium]
MSQSPAASPGSVETGPPDADADVAVHTESEQVDLNPKSGRKRPAMAQQLVDWLGTGWQAAPVMPHPADGSGAASTAAHRAALSGHFAGRLIVVPSGQLLTRANDTQYPFRASSAFTWLTGETVEGAVLVLTPRRDAPGHEAVLYVREYHQPGTQGYFTDHLFGAIWVGNVPTPAETESALGLTARPLSDLPAALSPWKDEEVALLAGHDALVDPLLPRGDGATLAAVIDELRLVKTEWEIGRLRHACQATARGFADVAREIPLVLDRPVRGERWLEGTFWRRARLEGNEVGYNSIIGSGANGTTLHWWRNHGSLSSGDLLLADMGVESDDLYTADVTRTFPLSGEWSQTQRMVYEAVREAQAAGIAECQVGNDFLAPHHAAMRVLAEHLHSWGILDVTPDVSCAADADLPGAGRHRRWTLHGVSHSLGIDVHDCAQSPDEAYTKGILGANHVLTVEPGLYFQVNDGSVPPEFRGLSVRIEDDIQVTNSGPVNLSQNLPREPAELTAWLRECQNAKPEFS